MIKNYIKKMVNPITRWTSLVAFMFSAQAGYSQLSGTVTVGSGGTYSSLSGLATAVASSGVSSKLTVNVISNFSETGAVTFAQPSSNQTSSTNNIVINGNGYKMTSSNAGAGIAFNGMDYVTIEGLTIEMTAATSAKVLHFYNRADYNTIEKCTLQFSGITSSQTSTSTGSAYVWFSTATTSLSGTTSYNGIQNTINGCLMRTTNSNSPGPTYAIGNYGSSSVYTSNASNNTFSNNTIQNYHYYTYYTFYTNGDQLVGNDISRENATSNNAFQTQYLFYSYYTYSTNRATKIDDNKVHDLPFKGATTGFTSTFYGLFAYYNYGTSTNYFSFSGNTFENLVTSGTSYGTYCWYNYWFKMDNNKMLKWTSTSTSTHYTFYTYYAYNDFTFSNNQIRNCFTKGTTYWAYHFYPTQVRANDNIIKNNITADGSTGFTYGLYIYKSSSTAYVDEIERNVIDSNTVGSYAYLTYLYYINGKINKNQITNNRIYNANYSSYYGYIYALFTPYFLNLQLNNNLVANNQGTYGVFCFYGYSYVSGTYRAEVKQNTFSTNHKNVSYQYSYTYGLYFYPYYHTDIEVAGNIVEITDGYGAYPVYTYNLNGATPYKIWDYNTYYTNNLSFQYWYCNNGTANDYNGWKNLGFAGNNENFLNPMWKDVSKNDYRSDAFETQNNVPALTSLWPLNPTRNEEDIKNAKRNKVRSDRGAMENYMNIAKLSTKVSLPATVCAGTTVDLNIKIKNTFVDTIYNFNVAAEATNVKKISQKVTNRILAGDSSEITFTEKLVLSVAGKTQLKVYIDAGDDNLADDTFYFETEVLPAPGGANFRNPSAKSTAAVYQLGKANDVTVINEPVFYDIPAPTKYSNSTYGTSSGDWQAFVSAKTKGGRAVSGASITVPTSSKNMEVKFVTSDASLEDTMITLTLRVLDNNNNCDTFITRNVFIYPSITPLFTVPSQICEGNAVLFENKSKVLSGSMEFKWNFGTGNAADTTDAPEPVFQFPGNGTYKVKLTAKTVPFGFAFDTIIDVTVNPIPTIAFTKTNACEGENLTFTNKTTPSAAKSTWDFGDGTTSTVANPTKKYTKAGQYTVTLNADLGGCIATMTQKVYQFTRPKAAFDKVVGSCDNDEFEFNNKTTVTAGLFGNNWNFDDNGNVSTDLNPTHDFQTAGNKNVKLVVTSEFGCKDSITKVVAVKPSPKASFVNGPLCSVKPTDFTNTTPDVSGTIANYAWSFGDGSTSGAKSPTKDWFGNLGPKKVTLKVTLDNGCTESVSKDLVVLTQPKPNFSAEDVCAGEDVIFVNNTTWAQGDITYRWNFGDGTESTNSDPTKKYNTSVTLTPFITLYAYIQGGCGDSITKNITINETPRTCDFVAAPDYASGFYGMKFDPINTSGVVGGQPDVEYIWVFEGGGTKKSDGPSATVKNNFATDGTYKVTMRAMMKQTKCECSVSKLVEMNRSSAESLMTSGVAVYPNPNNGQFTVATTEAFGKNVTVEVMNLSGAVVKRMSNQVGGMISVDASEVSNGMYLVKVMSGDKVVSTKINIQH